jgi:hypothetical protein
MERGQLARNASRRDSANKFLFALQTLRASCPRSVFAKIISIKQCELSQYFLLSAV